MGLLDSLIEGQFFWRELDGRTVFYPLGKSKTGYVVGSQAEASKIRAFVKSHIFARLAVIGLGQMLGYGLGIYLIHTFFVHTLFERSFAALAKGIIVMAITVIALLLLPALFEWRLYQQGIAAFTTGLEEGPAAPRAPRPWAVAAVGVAAGVVLLVVGILTMVRSRP